MASSRLGPEIRGTFRCGRTTTRSMTRSPVVPALLALALLGPTSAGAAPPKWSKPVGPVVDLPAHKIAPKQIKGLAVDCSAKTTVALPPISFGTLVPTRGDTEFAGRAELQLLASLDHSPRGLRLSGSVRIGEQGGTTRMVRSVRRRIDVTVPTGCQIASVSRAGDNIKYESGGEHGARRIYGSDLVAEATCIADTDGDDFGRVGCRDVKFRPVVVEFEPAAPADCTDVDMWLPLVELAPFHRSHGDGEMGGNRAYVEVTSKVEALPDGRVRARASAKIEEDGGDRSTYKAAESLIVFDVDRDRPGCRVTGLEDAEGFLGDRTPHKNEHRVQDVGDRGPGGGTNGHIGGASCRTDTNGEDDGRLSCLVSRRPVLIKLAPR